LPSLLWFFDNLFNLSFFFSVGPLLPENLDVRAIPIKKGRQLTIALSGKILHDVNAQALLLDSVSTAHTTKRHEHVSISLN